MSQNETNSSWFKQIWWLGPVVIVSALLFVWLSSLLIPKDLTRTDVFIRVGIFLGTVLLLSFLATLFGPGRNMFLNIRRTKRLERAIQQLNTVVEQLREEKKGEVNNLAEKLNLLRELINVLWQKELPFLLPIEEMERIEGMIETVWVFSRALNEDQKIYKKIYRNLCRGVHYKYMIPPKTQGATAEDQLDWLINKWTELAEKEGKNASEIIGRIEKKLINKHCFVATVIVYDVASNPKVIVKLPSDLPHNEYGFALQIQPKDTAAIQNTISCLQDLLQKDCPLLTDVIKR